MPLTFLFMDGCPNLWLMQSLKSLRAQLLLRRRQLAPALYTQRNTQIATHCLGVLKQQYLQGHCQALHTFLPIHSNAEPDTAPMYQWAWEQGLPVYTTRIESDKTLVHVLLAPASLQTCGRLNIPTVPEALPLLPSAIKYPLIVLVPLLAFDQKGNRLGYGQGYYDALLHQMYSYCPRLMAIGLSLTAPMEYLPAVHAKDYPLNACVTPFKTYLFV